mgnify:CR=1 FL=1
MIRHTTIEACYPLAQTLAKKGLKLSSIEQTPIQKLIQAAHIELPANAKELGLDLDIVNIISEGSKNPGPRNNYPHDMAMEELTETVSNTVKRNLQLAKNTVNPIIIEAIEDTEEYLRATIETRSTHIEIKPYYYAPIFNFNQLSTMVERFVETNFKDISLTLGFDYPSDKESLFKLAKTDINSFDETLMEFFTNMSEEDLATTFNSVFGPDAIRQSRLSDVIGNGNKEKTLLIYLFSKGLLKNVPESLGSNKDVDLAGYRNYISQIIAQSGRTLLSILSNRERDLTRNVLLRPFPSTRELGQRLITIEVNGDVYEKFLNEGGTPETIFGSFVSDQERSFSKLIDNNTKYQDEWKKKNRILVTGERLEKFNDGIDGIKLALTKQINQLDEEMVPVAKEILHQRLKESMSKVSGKFYENLPVYIRKIVCEVMFPHTNALEILCAIDSVSSDFPDIDVREAALLATIEIVANWISKLMKIDYVGV